MKPKKKTVKILRGPEWKEGFDAGRSALRVDEARKIADEAYRRGFEDGARKLFDRMFRDGHGPLAGGTPI